MGLRDTLLVLMVVIIWGLNFPFSKYGVSYIPPFLFTALRFGISFLVLLPFNPLPRGNVKAVFILSLVFGFGHFGLLFYGLSLDIESSTASLLMQIGPVLAVVVGAAVLKERFSVIQTLGRLTSVLGTTMIIGLPETTPSPLAASLVLTSAFLWAVSTMMMKNLKGVAPLQLMCWVSAFTFPMFAALWGILEDFHLPQAPPLAYASVLYPSLASTVLAYGVWNHLLQRIPISLLSPFGLLVPFFGVLGGVLILEDTLEFWEILGGSCLLIGVFGTSVYPALRRSRLGSPTG